MTSAIVLPTGKRSQTLRYRPSTELPQSKVHGFTLLELIIVLLVMVGMLAVVWPNLARPLQRTSLDEAAQMVRDAIDESRYQSALRGAPYFVLLQAGSGQLFSGSFESFLNSDSEADSPPMSGGTSGGLGSSFASPGASSPSVSFSGARSTGTPRSYPVRTWELPTSVVVSRVDWTLEAPYSSAEDEDAIEFPAANPPTEPVAAGTMEAVDSSSLTGSVSGRQWWLPLTAVGRGRDATIELFDASINQRLRVTYSSATGALEITR